MADGDTAVVYRSPLPGWVSIAVIGLMLVGLVVATVAVAFGIGTDDTGPPPPWFLPAVWVAWFWLAFGYLVWMAPGLRLDAGRLSWRAPLRSGSVPTDEVVVVTRMLTNTVRFRLRTGLSVVVFDGSGLNAFVEALRKQNPRVDVRL